MDQKTSKQKTNEKITKIQNLLVNMSMSQGQKGLLFRELAELRALVNGD